MIKLFNDLIEKSMDSPVRFILTVVGITFTMLGLSLFFWFVIYDGLLKLL